MNTNHTINADKTHAICASEHFIASLSVKHRRVIDNRYPVVYDILDAIDAAQGPELRQNAVGRHWHAYHEALQTVEEVIAQKRARVAKPAPTDTPELCWSTVHLLVSEHASSPASAKVLIAAAEAAASTGRRLHITEDLLSHIGDSYFDLRLASGETLDATLDAALVKAHQIQRAVDEYNTISRAHVRTPEQIAVDLADIEALNLVRQWSTRHYQSVVQARQRAMASVAKAKAKQVVKSSQAADLAKAAIAKPASIKAMDGIIAQPVATKTKPAPIRGGKGVRHIER